MAVSAGMRAAVAARRLAACRRHLAADAAHSPKYDWAAIRPPPLPLPSLEDTATRYVEQLHPLLPAAELETAEAEVAEFVAGPGRVLHERLAAAAAASPDTSYIKPFWDSMYLGGRYPLPTNSNPFVLWHPDPDPAGRSQAARAATLVHHALAWRQAMQRGAVEPDGTAKHPMCMSDYSRLFGTSRVPVAGGADTLLTDPTARHVVVLRGAGMWKLTVVDNDGRVATVAALEAAFRSMIDGAAAVASAPPLAALTSWGRDEWGDARDAILRASPGNREALHAIESAILHVCLDVATPASTSELYAACMHGGASEEARWFDKSISLICTPNGEAAVNMEHSPFDGSTLTRMQNDVWHMAAGRSSGKDVPAEADVSRALVPTPEPVTVVTSPDVDARVAAAADALARLRSATSVEAVEFDEFGTDEIRGWGREFGPDAVVQMALQLAYARTHGRTNISVYASASTKQFRHGRTEAVRGTSRESVALVSHFLGPGATAAGERDAAKGRELLRAAVLKHRARSKEASKGLGVDRHLFALSRLAAGSCPGMFGAAWAAHQKSTLSTSNLSVFGPSVACAGFGAVCDDGYGVGYVCAHDSIRLCVSNFAGDRGTGGAGFGGVKLAAGATMYDTSSARFAREVVAALKDFRSLFA